MLKITWPYVLELEVNNMSECLQYAVHVWMICHISLIRKYNICTQEYFHICNNSCTCFDRFFENRYSFLKESKVTWQLEKKQSIAYSLNDHRSLHSHCDED